MQHNNNTTESVRLLGTRIPLALDKRLAVISINLDTSKQALVAKAIEELVVRKETELGITGGKRHGKNN